MNRFQTQSSLESDDLCARIELSIANFLNQLSLSTRDLYQFGVARLRFLDHLIQME